MNWRDLCALPRRVPLSLRVALVVSPAIVAAQFLTMELMRGSRPIVALYNGPPPPAIDGTAELPIPLPGSRLEVLRLPDEAARQLTADELKRFRARASAFHDRVVRSGFRAEPRRPPWRALLAIFGVTAVLVWIAAAWITRPLARLADAAEALGRDMDHPALDDVGPPEVRRAARAFNGMQDRLRRFVRGRADALLAMSHDLKTPITRLQLRMELMPDDQRAGFAEDVDLLQSRVEHALGFMRGVHRDEPMRPVALDALAATVVEHQQDLGAQVTLQGSTPPLPCRPAQLERAIANLVENAVRHAGSAEVEIGERDGVAWIAVRDHGPGVPEALLPRLTEPFFRVEASRNRDSGGSGLGLAIVKDIVEAHGGALRIANRAGGGLEVRMDLPRR
ncbi:MAG: ATP-binding protein [Panacagrimonas sp.]